MTVRIGKLQTVLQAGQAGRARRGRAAGLRVRHPAHADDPGHPRPRVPRRPGRRPRRLRCRDDRPARRLEKRGFLKRTPAPDDRRRVDIEVTREGRGSGAGRWRCAGSPRTSCRRTHPQGAGHPQPADEEDDPARRGESYLAERATRRAAARSPAPPPATGQRPAASPTAARRRAAERPGLSRATLHAPGVGHRWRTPMRRSEPAETGARRAQRASAWPRGGSSPG